MLGLEQTVMLKLALAPVLVLGRIPILFEKPLPRCLKPRFELEFGNFEKTCSILKSRVSLLATTSISFL